MDTIRKAFEHIGLALQVLDAIRTETSRWIGHCLDPLLLYPSFMIQMQSTLCALNVEDALDGVLGIVILIQQKIGPIASVLQAVANLDLREVTYIHGRSGHRSRPGTLTG